MDQLDRIEARPEVGIAYRTDGPVDDGSTCGFLWLGGFKSDMTGTKAEALAALARETNRPCLRFDYSGHGVSEGSFTDGTISFWLSEALLMFRKLTRGPRIVIGSSMGGWLALLMLRALGAEAKRIRGLILIAPAVDMTASLMWDAFPREIRETLLREGVWLRPSAYGEPYPITSRLIEDGRRHLLLDQGIDIACPVRILQGDRDEDVPWTHAKRVFDAIRGDDIRLVLVKGGDHRLSAPADLKLLKQTVAELALRVDRQAPLPVIPAEAGTHG